MIEIGGTAYSLQDPVVWVALGGGGLLLLLVLLLIVSIRRAGRSAAAAEKVSAHMAGLGQRVQML